MTESSILFLLQAATGTLDDESARLERCMVDLLRFQEIFHILFNELSIFFNFHVHNEEPSTEWNLSCLYKQNNFPSHFSSMI